MQVSSVLDSDQSPYANATIFLKGPQMADVQSTHIIIMMII